MSLIDQSLAPFEKQLEVIGREIQAELLMLLGDFQKSGGKLISNNVNLQLALGFSKNFQEILNETGYNDFVKDFSKSNTEFIDKLAKTSTIPLAFTKTDQATFQTLKTIDISELFNIGRDAGAVLQTNLTSSVLSGQPLKDVKNVLISKLKNNLQRYAETYITTSRQILMQKAELLGVDNPDKYAWEYTGPRDNKNRPECAMGKDKQYFTNKEMEEFEANYGLRWNCRHVFMAVDKKYLTK